MNANIPTTQQKELLQQLGTLIEETAIADRKLHEELSIDLAAVREQFDAANRKLEETARAGIEKLDDQYLHELEASRLKFERDSVTAENDRNQTSDDVARHRATEVKKANDDYDAMLENIAASFEQDQAKTHERHKKFLVRCKEDESVLAEVAASAQEMFLKRRCRVDFDDVECDVASAKSDQHLSSCHDVITFAASKTAEIRSSASSRYLDEGWFVLQFIFAAIAVCGIAWYAIATPLLFAGLLGAGVSLLTSCATMFLIGRMAHKNAVAAVPELDRQLGRGRASLLAANAAKKLETARELDDLKLRRQQQTTEVTNERDTQVAAAEQRYAQRRNKLEKLFAQRVSELEATWNAETTTIRNHYGPLIDATRKNAERKAAELRETYDTKVAQRNTSFYADSKRLCTKWSQTLGEFQSTAMKLREFCDANFPDLKTTDWTTWKASGESLKAIQLGDFVAKAEQLSPEIPTSEELVPCPREFSLPAMLTFPELPSLVINAEGDGRAEAVSVMQNAMLRLLTSLPPGKVRFTIVDPVGLGQNFSAFMHLADFDDRLVTSRIWTETAHINQRLGDLTEHMENVIQKYLRNEFASIHEYNEHAGEVAEPFHILVVANFPANFSDETARRLVSIASSGPKCGVYTLLSRDTRLALPRSFDATDVERHANTLDWAERQICLARRTDA